MPLPILVPILVVGLVLIAAALHLTGRSRARTLTPDAAMEAWRREQLSAPLTAVLSDNRRGALIETPDGLGLVWVMGADTTARPLADAKVTERRAGLRIELGDFTAPSVLVRLTPEARATWQRRIREDR